MPTLPTTADAYAEALAHFVTLPRFTREVLLELAKVANDDREPYRRVGETSLREELRHLDAGG